LSLYLLLLCAEGLSSLLNHAEMNESIVGVQVYRDAPMVSHLLFADDSLILMQLNGDNAIISSKFLRCLLW
jgi:hypothetical protein